MNRLLTATVVSSLLLSGAAAEAAKKPSPRANVFGAALTATSDSTGSAVTGKAQMVDSRRSDSAKIQLAGLPNPGSRYDWTIFRVKGDAGACDPAARGETVSAFRYKVLEAAPSGNASATAKSRAFQAVSTTRYGVAVSDSEGVVVACGELKRVSGKKPRG